jgi:hypothetical protein
MATTAISTLTVPTFFNGAFRDALITAMTINMIRAAQAREATPCNRLAMFIFSSRIYGKLIS